MTTVDHSAPEPPQDVDLHPVREKERLEILDALRGACILGILAVNMFAYGLPGMAFMMRGTWGDQTFLDHAAHALVSVLFTQKFYPILSLLFGVGMFLQLSKPRPGGGSPLPRYMWRTALLLVLGVIHGVLFFHGDILFVYACCAFIAACFWRVSAKAKLITGSAMVASFAFCCMPSLMGLAMFGVSMNQTQQGLVVSDDGPPPLAYPLTLEESVAFAEERDLTENLILFVSKSGTPESDAVVAAAYAEGSFLEVTAYRTITWILFMVNAVFGFGPMVIGLMLIGMWTMEIGLWRDPTPYLKRLRIAAVVGWVVGLPIQMLSIPFGTVDYPFMATLYQAVGSPFLVTGYICTFILMWNSEFVRKLSGGLKAVGRTALTNYLGQSVVFTTLFMGYGFGLFGELNFAALLGLTLVSWGVQMLLSWLWLKKFRMGPIEWAWRSAAYGSMQPMMR